MKQRIMQARTAEMKAEMEGEMGLSDPADVQLHQQCVTLLQ